MTKLALITVLYKSDRFLEDFLSSLAKQSFKDYHLYLIDNSIHPDTDKLLETLLLQYPIPGTTHIKNPTNNGPAKGNNQGIRMALQGQYTHILLLNNDIALTTDDLLKKMMHLAITKREAIIMPKMLYYGTDIICMAGGSLNLQTAVSVHIGAGERDQGQYNRSAYFNFGPTTFMLFSREVFEQVGLIDEGFFAYYEDTDLIYRAGLRGYRVFYMPDLVIFHKESATHGGHRSPFFIYYINRNRIYFIKKHFTGWRFLRALGAVLLDFLRMFKHYTNAQRKILAKAMWHGCTGQLNN